MKNRFNSTLRRLFANQTKPAGDVAAAKKRKAGADAGKSKRLRGSASVSYTHLTLPTICSV